jgi:hypothetical protein
MPVAHANEQLDRGGIVKRIISVMALAAMLLFAVAGSAFAVNQSAQQRLGAPVPVVTTLDASGAVQYGSGGESAINGLGITVPGAGTYTYENWQPDLLGNAQTAPTLPNFAGNSPHGNFTTTTVKCVVCHAVHYAAPSGSPVAGNSQVADTLLRVRADQACVYCHATAGQAVNGRPVYNGLGAALITPTSTSGDNNVGHTTGANCSTCHTNVHGAGADTSVASLNGYLLNAFTTTGVDGSPAVTTDNMLSAIDYVNGKAQAAGFGDALPADTSVYANNNSSLYREQAVGIFCAECHNGAYATGQAGATTSIRSGATSVSFTGHRIAASATSTWNQNGTVSSGDRTIGTVAWAEAANCKSCHDATDNYGNAAFPHAWGAYNINTNGANSSKMWLTMAANAGAAKVSVGPGATADAAAVQLQDGVCLKCHVSSDGSAGVGITF